MIGAAALGRMWRASVAQRPAPRAMEAVTNSSFLTSMTAPRVMRAICGQPKTPRTRTTVRMERWDLNMLITTMAASMKGMAKKMSVTRDSSESNHPPKYPAMAPTREPTTTTRMVVRTPTLTEARAP